jgi:hypothetical protein
VKLQQREPRFVLAFTSQETQSAKRRKEYLAHKGDSHNLRSAVEANVRSVKHPFPSGKMPVRGQFRVTSMVIASAATTNVRRIQRYMIAKTKATKTSNKGEGQSTSSSDESALSFFCHHMDILDALVSPKPDISSEFRLMNIDFFQQSHECN